MTEYTLYAGCSFTFGTGFNEVSQSPMLWTNLLHKSNFELSKTKSLNCSLGGRSNSGIFQDAVTHITRQNIKYAFIAWSSIPRYELSLGLELYETRCHFIPNGPLQDFNLHSINYTKSYLENIRDRFVCLHHLHAEILKVVYYVNSLVAIGEKFGTRIFFINALCPWDQDYFTYKTNVLPDQFTPFTQSLIETSTRDDNESFALYNKMHNEYKLAGGIQPEHWVNLYQSFKDLQIDTNSDNLHPGPLSNQRYADLISNSLSL